MESGDSASARGRGPRPCGAWHAPGGGCARRAYPTPRRGIAPPVLAGSRRRRWPGAHAPGGRPERPWRRGSSRRDLRGPRRARANRRRMAEFTTSAIADIIARRRARNASRAVSADDGPTRRNDEGQHGRAGPAHGAPGRTGRARAHEGRARAARDAGVVPARVLRAGRPRRPGRPGSRRPLWRRALALGLRAQARAGSRARARVQSDDRGARLAVDAHDRRDRQRRHVVSRRLGHDGSEPARAHAAPHRPSDHRRHARRGRDADRRGGRGRGRGPARVVHPRRGRSRQRPGGARGARRRRRCACCPTCALRWPTGRRCRTRRAASRPSSRSVRRRFPRPNWPKAARSWRGSPGTTSRSWATAGTISSTSTARTR